MRARARAILAPTVAAKLPAIAAMDQYFLDDRPVAEAQASTAWFEYAERNGIDLPRAISLWEDASTPEGEASRQVVDRRGSALSSIRDEPAARSRAGRRQCACMFEKRLRTTTPATINDSPATAGKSGIWR